MNDTVRKDILSVLEKVMEILKKKEDQDTYEMKELSNHTLHNASIFQDEDSISLAVLVYAMSKLIERKIEDVHYGEITVLIKGAHDQLIKDTVEPYRRSIKRLFKLLNSLDLRLQRFIEEVINQAQIRKGSKIYEHGISMERTASILGISEWELMGYIGKTNITEIPLREPISVRERVAFTRKLFS